MAEPIQLPPLILHPFSGGSSTSTLLEGSQASLALHGLANSYMEDAELVRRMVSGRYQEIRMLVFLGKDLARWLHQCVEQVGRAAAPDTRINLQSFAALLVEDPPDVVKEKLSRWGVSDRRSVFSRAIGMHSLFEDPPPVEMISRTLLDNYHRFADYAYMCHQHLKAYLPVTSEGFIFEIYASEEYSRMLSEQWEQA